MKIIWTIVTLLLIAGIVVVLQPPAPTRRPDDSAMLDSAERAMELATAAATSTATSTNGAATAPSTPDLDAALAAKSGAPSGDASSNSTDSTDSRESATAPTTDATNSAKENASSIAAAPAETPATTNPAASGPAAAEATTKKPSPEPTAAKPEEIAAGSEFTPEIPTIAFAEILPSRFVKLADGDISVDDAWTVRGAGTNESPYEVSWEYLSSAQETYVPRLSEKKIPARIAFLHGKVVKISGYLAFPLVAPTSSECLAMLNQWDGCCIGIPPTPYDAIEVKLATELKGWKKHTINFGTITGVFKVEPYLVENWLVGLYLMEKSKIDTEL
ncbi:MAG: hypothetical protein RL591_776 [Planctomycetota bacterium]